MGMFDRFIVDVTCPHCEDHITEIQTNQLECNMDEYRIGDTINFLYDMCINSGYLVEDSCCSCLQHKDREWRLHITNGVFTHVTKFTAKDN